ncbi:glycosyltransferase family 4 protein [Aquirhabdus sp.]|uniref:glycosyltransferase family 4 protein n=1 Tax=Aquirhabdus sp. TaxID=2824160 RepID=UPI00396CE45E
MTDIVLDITRIVGRSLKGRLPTGVDRVCFAYLDHFKNAQAFLHIRGKGIVLTQEDSTLVRSFLLNQDVKSLKGKYEQVDFLTHLLAKVVRSTRVKPIQNAFFINVGHSGLEHARYISWLQQNPVRPIYMVHDLIPITHPEYCREGEISRHTSRMKAMLETASGLITNSQDTLNELDRFTIRHQLKQLPSLVAHLGILPAVEYGHTASPIPMPYFIMLGTIEPRKNHLLILNVWRKLIGKYGDNTPKLVLIGQRGWECEQVVDMLERCPQLKGIVIELSEVSDLELAQWLQHTKALLFPSFAEGFGLPLIEALQQGVTVLASDLPVFHEIVGNAPHYLDPIDGLGWMQAIESIWLDHAQPPKSITMALPTWTDHFRKVDAWLKQV